MKLLKASSVFVVITLIFGGCNLLKKDQPTKEEITAAVSSDFPSELSLVEVVSEWVPGAAKGAGTVNVKVTMESKVDLLALPPEPAVAEIRALLARNDAVFQWRQQYLLNSMLNGDKPAINLEPAQMPQLLKVQQKKGERITFYGKMKAEKQVDRWVLTRESSDFPELGAPQNTFPQKPFGYVVQGTPEAADALKKLQATVEANEAAKKEFIASLERKAKEATDKLAEMKKSQRDGVLAGSAPSVTYAACYICSTLLTEKVLVTFEKNEMDGALIEFKVASAAQPNQYARYKGHLALDNRGFSIIEAKISEIVGGQYTLGPKETWNHFLAEKTMDCQSLRIEKSFFAMACNRGTIEGERTPDNQPVGKK